MTTAGTGRTFGFAPGLSLRVTGDRGVISHFDAEYGRATAAGNGDKVTAAFSQPWGRRRETETALRHDAHRWLAWDLRLSAPSASRVDAWITIHGRPRSVVLSLVQGYVVEPLVSLMAPDTGHVLVPGAAIQTRRGLVLVLGPSGAGKSTVSARAMTDGAGVLGDDQVFVDATGLCLPMPRRVRIYPDLQLTAPESVARLASATRARLTFHALLARTTRGRLRPSLPVDRAVLGARADPVPARLTRVVIVEPRSAVDTIDTVRASPGDAVASVEHLLRAQRARLGRVAAPEWQSMIERIARDELRIVAEAIRGVEISRVRIPRSWPAVRAIDGLAAAVGLDPSTCERAIVPGSSFSTPDSAGGPSRGGAAT